MTSKQHYVLHAVLLAACIGLGAFAWRTRTQLDRAERYAQSGIDSVTSICSSVLFEIRQGSLDRGVWSAARECIGDVSPHEVERVSTEIQRRDVAAITSRLDQNLKQRILPRLTLDPVRSDFLPKGYRD